MWMYNCFIRLRRNIYFLQSSANSPLSVLRKALLDGPESVRMFMFGVAASTPFEDISSEEHPLTKFDVAVFNSKFRQLPCHLQFFTPELFISVSVSKH